MTYRILNLGAGVQSTVVALMIHKGELPPIHCAIFADVQEEPDAVYRHLEWLIKEVSPSFPVWVRTAGRLGDGLIARAHRKGHTTIPAFTLNTRDGSIGMVRRQCTGDYKIDVVDRAIRRELLALKLKARWPKDVVVEQLFGLSFEELGRMVRVNSAMARRYPGGRSFGSFPLVDREMTRRVCRRWLSDYGVPHEVERSACVFCPYKSDAEWERTKRNPKSWARVVEVDALIRSGHAIGACGMKNPQFLHHSCVPIDQVDFTTPESRGDQGELGFVQECEGMCGN